MFQGSFEQKFSWPVTSGFFSEGIAHKVQTIKRKTFITKIFLKKFKTRSLFITQDFSK